MSPHLLDTAIGGVIAAQWFLFLSNKIERREKHAALQRERLERISDHVGDSIVWAQGLALLQSFERVRSFPVSPEARRIAMLSRIYFPDMEDVAMEYVNSLVEYHCFAIDCFETPAPEGTTIGARMVLNPKSRQHEEKQFSLRNKLDEAIAKEAHKYEPPT